MTKSLISEPSFRATALSVGRTVADRLLDSKSLSQGIQQSSHQTSGPTWTSLDHSFLAVLCGLLEYAFPCNNYDLLAHHHLAFAVQNNRQIRNISLFGGLTQIGMATRFLNSQSERYGKLLTNIDVTANKEAELMALAVTDAAKNGTLSFAKYDIVSGLAGVAIYLISRTTDGYAQSSLEAVLRALIYLSQSDENSLMNLKTPRSFVNGFLAGRSVPYDALVNCGLAHGVPGVLGALSLAHQSGLYAPDLAASVQRVLQWLTAHSMSDEWGNSWPDAIAIDSDNKYFSPSGITMDAWCYGSIGTARAVYLASKSLGDLESELFARQVVEDSILGRSRTKYKDLSPTICHGLSGMLLACYRFHQDTKSDVLGKAAKQLLDTLTAKYDDSLLFGFRDVNNHGIQVDDPSFLTGACGIAMVLLTIANPHGMPSSSWDRILLLS